jgi:hypothetical protein
VDKEKLLMSQPLSENEENSAIALPALLSRLDQLISVLSRPNTTFNDQLWDVEQIAVWMKLSVDTIARSVVTRSDFPKPLQPVGTIYAQKRWFAGEIIKWAREHRAILPIPRPGRRRTKLSI